MIFDADVIIIGSGPSGVSAAFPLLERGMQVLLLDGGKERPHGLLPTGSYHDIRRQEENQWTTFLGQYLEALNPDHPPSPKFDAPGSRFSFEEFADSQGMIGQGFTVVGSLARGGLSNIWGAGIAIFDEKDLADFPLKPSDFAPSYQRIAERIGITGFNNDDLATNLDAEMPVQPPMRLCENADQLLTRYNRRRTSFHALGFRLGRSRAAVLTEPKGNRKACTYCDMCIWGCGENSIYSATHDLDALQTYGNLDYRPGTLVERIEKIPEGYCLIAYPEGKCGTSEPMRFSSRILILAAGTLVTTRLVLDLEGKYGENLPILNTPTIGFALCLPERIGDGISTREFSMAQVSFIAAGSGGRPEDAAYGSLFPASGIPGSLVVEHMPVTRPAAIKLFRYLQPSLLLGNCFLPGHYSRNVAQLEQGPHGKPRLHLRGGTSDALPKRISFLKRQLRKAFGRLGALVIPGSVKTLEPGEDMRYSGTIPMHQSPAPGQVSRFGELFGAPGLYIVDMSIFPSMPAKHHTFTMMANADRIGNIIAKQWISVK